MDLPSEIVASMPGRSFVRVSLGASGAAVWRSTMEHSIPLYLKAAVIAADLRLDGEADRLRWMKDHDLPVPVVSEYRRIGNAEYLILEEVPGIVASDPRWTPSLPDVVTALGTGLARLHQTGIADCPFDARIARQLETARHRIAAGHVREDDFDEIRAGCRATDLLTELLESVPTDEDLVFTHGDFCLPNIILQREDHGDVHIAGLIDCGRSGVADRHQDIALAIRSITRNLGRDWVLPFLQAYGLPQPRAEKLRFFTVLDEFF